MTIALSAQVGLEGLDLLREHLKACMGFEQTSRKRLQRPSPSPGGTAAKLQASLEHGRNQLTLMGAGELLAEDLRHGPAGVG